jgi:hypothetical protein
MANMIKRNFGGHTYAVLSASARAEIEIAEQAEQAQRSAVEVDSPVSKKARAPRARPVPVAPPPDAEQEDGNAFE